MADEITWLVEVDWDNDDSYSGDESNYLRDVTIRRGRRNLIDSAGDGRSEFSKMDIGECVLKLDNSDGRYYPLNASSALYPNVKPGRKVRVRATVGANTYYLFVGKLDNIIFDDNPVQLSATFTIYDGWKLLSETYSPSALSGGAFDQPATSGNQLTSSLGMLAAIFASGWPFSAYPYDVDLTPDTIPWLWRNDDISLYDVVHDMAEADQGIAVVAADGEFVYRSRQTLFGEVSAFTLSDAELHDESRLAQPWDLVQNRIRIPVNARVVQNAHPASPFGVATTQDQPYLEPGDSVHFIIRFEGGLPVNNVQVVVANTDYHANTAADGSGTDLTSDFDVTNFVSTVAWCEFDITNNHATLGGYVTDMAVRGKTLGILETRDTLREDSASQTDYGVRELFVDNIYLQNPAYCADMSDFLLQWLAEGQVALVAVLMGEEDIQFGNDIATYLTVDSAHLGVDQLFRIGGVEHFNTAERGQAMKTIWYLEPAANQQAYWVLGNTGTSELGETTRLVF